MSYLQNLRQNQILLKCEICDKEFKNNKSLEYHVNIIHNLEKNYLCNICQKVFYAQSRLTSHMKIVHEKKKHHKCGSCNKPFSTHQNLNKHISAVIMVKETRNVKLVESY